jgi:hypothetical protein
MLRGGGFIGWSLLKFSDGLPYPSNYLFSRGFNLNKKECRTHLTGDSIIWLPWQWSPICPPTIEIERHSVSPQLKYSLPILPVKINGKTGRKSVQGNVSWIGGTPPRSWVQRLTKWHCIEIRRCSTTWNGPVHLNVKAAVLISHLQCSLYNSPRFQP